MKLCAEEGEPGDEARSSEFELANQIAALPIFNQAARASFCDVTGGWSVWARD